MNKAVTGRINEKRNFWTMVLSISFLLIMGFFFTDIASAGNIHAWICKGEAYGWKDNEQFYYGDEVYLNYEFTGAGNANYDLQLNYCDPDGNWWRSAKKNKMSKAYIHWVCNKLGTYKGEAVITGEEYGSVGVDFNVQRVPLSMCTVTGGTGSYTYTGDPVKPSYTVKYTPSGGSEKTLVEGTDYTVNYGNNIKAGTGTATITGKGNYSGTIKKNFTITNITRIIYKDEAYKAYDLVYWVNHLGDTAYREVTEDKELFIRIPLDSELAQGSKIQLYKVSDKTDGQADFAECLTSAYCSETGGNSGYQYAEYPCVLKNDLIQSKLGNTEPKKEITEYRGKQRLAFDIKLANGQMIYRSSTAAEKNFFVNIVGKYNVYYNANGGTGAPSSQNKYINISIQLSKEFPKREGYTFKGWSTSSGGNTVMYLPGEEYWGNDDLHLYAVWKKVSKQIKKSDQVQQSGQEQETVNKRWSDLNEKSNVKAAESVSKRIKITTRASVSALKKLKKKYTITCKGRLKLKIKTKHKLSFKLRNKKIVTIDKNGKIVGKRCGSAKVIVKEQNNGKATTKAIKINVVPKTPKIKSMYRKNYFQVLILKKKDSSVTGYQICVAQSKKFKKGKRYIMSLANKGFKGVKTNIQMPSRSKYFVKIRAYKKIGKKTYYGAWSNIKVAK